MKSGCNVCLVLIVWLAIAVGCSPDYTPKPRAYFRIDLPQKQYERLTGDYPYHFDYPVYGRINPYKGQWKDTDTADYWVNLEIPQFRSRLHLTYKTIHNNLRALIEDAHTYAFKHSVKADAINQSEFSDRQANIYCTLFDIKGNTASSMQFYATDSVRHFLRGALYFDCEPNKDSLAPVTEFLRADIIKLIESLTWSKTSAK